MLVSVGFIVVVTCITPVPLATIPKPTFESVPVAVIVGSSGDDLDVDKFNS